MLNSVSIDALMTFYTISIC